MWRITEATTASEQNSFVSTQKHGGKADAASVHTLSKALSGLAAIGPHSEQWSHVVDMGD